MKKKLLFIARIAKRVTLFFFFIAVISCQSKSLRSYNLDFETLDSLQRPAGWKFKTDWERSLVVIQVDSLEKKQGRNSISIGIPDETQPFGSFSRDMDLPAEKGVLKLTGYLKTKQVAGYCGLWMRIDGKNKEVLAFDNMVKKQIKGTNDWQAFSIELNYDPEMAGKIFIGGLLSGKGKIWVDDMHVSISGKQIETVKIIDKTLVPADTAYRSSSRITSIPDLTPIRIKQLANLGKIWGFLKYYHPAIESGKYNWDAELFKILPLVLATKSNSGFDSMMNSWIDGLGPVPACIACDSSKQKFTIAPGYSDLFARQNLSASLIAKLVYLKTNHTTPAQSFYIGFKAVGNPEFKNEYGYNDILYPDAGIRLLALYRYWNMVQYFYPYRYLIEKDWDTIPEKFIPKFVNAENNKAYTTACLELIGRVRDTHANIWGGSRVLDSLKGTLITPFQAKFMDDKLTVTGYYSEDATVKNAISIGDIIEKINGVEVAVLVKKYLALTPASNYATQLRDLPSCYGFLLRSNDPTAELAINGRSGSRKIRIQRIPVTIAQTANIDWVNPMEKNGYRFINDSIGFIYPAKIKETSFDSIRYAFNHTKGIVIDLRCYPAAFMPFTYGAWFKSYMSPFVYLTYGSMQMPGGFAKRDPIYNGYQQSKLNIYPWNGYSGQLIILVNGYTQSQAEYTAMALSTVEGAIVIGSQTAGADGNVSDIELPGGIKTMISGLGVYYPDNTVTQGKGVKIDVQVRPSVQGIRAGKDELLDKALLLIKEHHINK